MFLIFISLFIYIYIELSLKNGKNHFILLFSFFNN